MSDKYNEIDFRVPPSQRHGVAFKHEIIGNMRDRLPEFPSLLSNALEELHIVMRRFFTETTNQSAIIVGNHAFNDLDSFIDCLLSGDGRSAARASRSLYEHLVNYCEVMSSPKAAERYLKHRVVTADLLGNLTHGLQYLKGNQHKQERSRLAKLRRDSLQPLRESLVRFGKNFRRDWSSRNLYDRAAAHGHDTHYDTYRLLSQVTHGSCGGVLGSYASIEGRTVHRTGPSLELAILSYLEGFTFFREFAKEVGARQTIETRKLVDGLDSLLNYWPNYRQALTEVDGLVWPETPPPGPIAIMAVYPNGRVRWFFWEPALNRMKLAYPPEGAEWMEARFRQHIDAGNIEIPADMEGRPITSAISGVQVTPREGSAWFAASGILTHSAKPETPWLMSE
ncbi:MULTISPECIES: DUF5677 domain-containing protein [unclassified Streptomyces]|uniref:DUF5677 domain-containing protein n=1 Tax=unclassified Streptomyces TaxID=2593676 RepID=UPI000A65B727|nr:MULTISPECIES: DUF5677 domain-containing protein [unclassified Streptomyces]